MTEEIIIDGVNVAGCDYYDNGECKCLLDCVDNRYLCMREININEDLCKDNPNCYYKQLKRAEIEIEKLKGVDGSVHPDSVYYKITRLEQERDELKKACEKCKLFHIEKTNRDLLERIDKLEQKNKELKEKLGKIYRLSDIAYNKILNSTEVSYGLNEIVDIQKIIKDDKTIYYNISTCNTERYRSALDTIQKMILSAWEMGKYLDGGLYEDLTNEFAKINEVLK